MSYQIRKYQKEDISNIHQAFDDFNQVVYVLATGGGKTVIASKIMMDYIENNKQILFLVHRKELIDQTALALGNMNIDYGFIYADCEFEANKKIYICSVQTLILRLEQYRLNPDLIIVDECHHVVSKTYTNIIKHFPNAKLLGLTATPLRLDGKGLSKIFEVMIIGKDTYWLIKNGFLSDYKLFSYESDAIHEKLKTCKISIGDYLTQDIEKIVEEKSFVGNVIKEYERRAKDKKAIVFCVNIRHSLSMKNEFKNAGYTSEHIDGNTPIKVRNDIINKFRNGEIQILTNVDIVGEGFDLPDVEVAILLRPTKSLALYLQQVGRALRKSNNKDYAIILDHVGNSNTHGLPCQERQWGLEGIDKKTKINPQLISPILCHKCGCMYRANLNICPNCGAENSNYNPSYTEEELQEKIRNDKMQKASVEMQIKTWKTEKQKEDSVMNRNRNKMEQFFILQNAIEESHWRKLQKELDDYIRIKHDIPKEIKTADFGIFNINTELFLLKILPKFVNDHFELDKKGFFDYAEEFILEDYIYNSKSI